MKKTEYDDPILYTGVTIDLNLSRSFIDRFDEISELVENGYQFYQILGYLMLREEEVGPQLRQYINYITDGSPTSRRAEYFLAGI